MEFENYEFDSYENVCGVLSAIFSRKTEEAGDYDRKSLYPDEIHKIIADPDTHPDVRQEVALANVFFPRSVHTVEDQTLIL